MTVPEISVSIVSMNNLDYLRRCLASLYRFHADLALEVIVVFYRTSPDAIAAAQLEFPEIKVVISGDDQTRGYGENQNLGLRVARGRYLVILNDDIVFMDPALRMLRDYSEQHPEVAALLPKLLNEDGTMQVGLRGHLTPWSFAAYILHLNPLLARSQALKPRLFDPPFHDAGGPVPAEAGSGAFFWVTRTALEQVGFMDERYFLAPDDIDLSMRLTRARAKVMYLPGVSAVHTGSTTLSRVFSKVLPVNMYGMIELQRVHFGPLASAITTGSVTASSLLSAAYWGFRWLQGDRKRAPTMLRARANIVRFLFSRPPTTKDVFLRAW